MENNRRKFIKNAATGLAGFFIVPRYVLGGSNAYGVPYIAPSDMINLGFIGGGKQGRILFGKFAGTKQSQVVALSEVFGDKAVQFDNQAKKVLTEQAGDIKYSPIKNYLDYRELLTLPNVDAVVISTPDHWHAAMAVNAAKAGKDIYCEKPLSLTVKEGRAMVNAARKYDRVFQTGSMQRSWAEFRQTAELLQNGYIGDIKHIKVNVGPPPTKFDLPEQPVPASLDWKKWLGPNKDFSHYHEDLAPPITRDIYPDWRMYKEFGGGKVTDWGAHMFDIVQWSLGMDESGPIKIAPPSADKTTPLTFTYANGITVSHEKWEWDNAIHFIGTEGDLKIKRKELVTTPIELKDRVIKDSEKKVYYSDDHYIDFFNAMRSRKKPICDVAIGHSTATMCNIANITYELGRELNWDPKAEKFKGDKAANKLLGRKMNMEWGIKI